MGGADEPAHGRAAQNPKIPLNSMRASAQDLIRAARALVLDFDGTLVDSNSIKLKAFDVCFANFSAEWPEIKAYCYRNNHTPRWEKFRYVYENILKLPYTEAVEKRLLDIYGEATTCPVLEAPEIPGATEFLRATATRLPIALVSSTPDDILRGFLKHRKWDDYFQSVRGAPVDKTAWIKEWCEKNAWGAQDILFLGDSPEDLQAARKAAVPFVAVVNEKVAEHADGFLKDWTEWKAVST